MESENQAAVEFKWREWLESLVNVNRTLKTTIILHREIREMLLLKTGMKEEDQMFWLSQKGHIHYLWVIWWSHAYQTENIQVSEWTEMTREFSKAPCFW